MDTDQGTTVEERERDNRKRMQSIIDDTFCAVRQAELNDELQRRGFAPGAAFREMYIEAVRVGQWAGDSVCYPAWLAIGLDYITDFKYAFTEAVVAVINELAASCGKSDMQLLNGTYGKAWLDKRVASILETATDADLPEEQVMQTRAWLAIPPAELKQMAKDIDERFAEECEGRMHELFIPDIVPNPLHAPMAIARRAWFDTIRDWTKKHVR